ncbi:ATP-grasp domain-containing protein [Aspergillus transmontanensis]|uniref:ATP-grasp domain-containing protein n=1 Tax=Aspergillus transmontanensis TaxID=1034304 RepID=A0A5N6WF71_9EURO|nr:ATP-grasp domain-containing protein [Aspergillus transmontanensis]
MSGIIIVKDENDHDDEFRILCTIISWQSIDICFREVSRSPSFVWATNAEDTSLLIEGSVELHRINPQIPGSTEAFQYLLDCLVAAGREHCCVGRVVVPQSRGYIVRSDIIPLRLLDYRLVTGVVGFASPHQFFEGESIRIKTLHQVQITFALSAGGMHLKQINIDNNTLDSQLEDLNVELRNRLSFPWLSMQKPERKPLALVEGGRRSPDYRGNGETVFTAAEALGIDMMSDEVFTRRVVDAIRAYDGHIDGLVTFCDHYQEPVAAAALELSLPACSPEAFALATDKFRLRVFEGHEAYEASSVQEATDIILEHKLEFPLIFKPRTGYLSEGVFRVESLAQIEDAVQSINVERHGAAFAIERYCDGPEVDANFILCDGEVLHFEVSDEFPKGADVNGDGNVVESFIELGGAFPSCLPADELALLRDSLHRSLCQMGFRDGVFHLEARVANSSMEWTTKDNVLDLTERCAPAKEKPSVWLIEVNPRPPGIDYWGVGLLSGLQDRQRVRQLSHTFLQGPQCWCETIFIPIEKGGIFDLEDVCLELFSRRPDLAECVSWFHCHYSKGARVPDPRTTGVFSWAAHFNIFSRSSRAHLLEIADCIKKEVRFSIV